MYVTFMHITLFTHWRLVLSFKFWYILHVFTDYQACPVKEHEAICEEENLSEFLRVSVENCTLQLMNVPFVDAKPRLFVSVQHKLFTFVILSKCFWMWPLDDYYHSWNFKLIKICFSSTVSVGDLIIYVRIFCFQFIAHAIAICGILITVYMGFCGSCSFSM